MNEAVVIVGPGRMGLALGAALRSDGALERLTYFGRALDVPPHPLFNEDARGAEYRLWPQQVPPKTSVVLLAVPDDALREVAGDLAATGPAPPGCVALHLSGAASNDVLGPLHAVGFAVGSMHPLQAIADPWSGSDRLMGSTFGVAGEPAALSAARRLVSALGGHALTIPPGLKPLYHAAAVFASNYLTTLVAQAADLMRQAGVADDDALPALLPLLRGTLNNIEELGLSSSLTGPIARGDVDTVRLHLASLSGGERDLYCALGRRALTLALGAGLDRERAADIEQLLDDD